MKKLLILTTLCLSLNGCISLGFYVADKAIAATLFTAKYCQDNPEKCGQAKGVSNDETRN